MGGWVGGDFLFFFVSSRRVALELIRIAKIPGGKNRSERKHTNRPATTSTTQQQQQQQQQQSRRKSIKHTHTHTHTQKESTEENQSKVVNELTDSVCLFGCDLGPTGPNNNININNININNINNNISINNKTTTSSSAAA